MGNRPEDILREYILQQRNFTIDDYPTGSIAEALELMQFKLHEIIHGDWVVIDDTNKPLEPIGIDEII